MTTAESIGTLASRETPCEFLTLAFSPHCGPLRSRWRNNGLSADFLGDYVTTFFPGKRDPAAASVRHSEIRHAVTYVANELLENAMKYHDQSADIPIGIHLELADDHVTVCATNGSSAEQAERYRSFADRILSEDANELYMQRLEVGASGTDESHSGLGLLTMITDYQAKLSWRFETHHRFKGVVTVSTEVVLHLNREEGAQS